MSESPDRAPVLDRETITKNVESVLRLEQEDERELSLAHRFSHRVGWFVGTVYFVLFQIFMTAAWVAWNWGSGRPFDPYPFPLLSCVLALEAVLLTSFVLIRQNAMDLQSERRNHLDLQINLLAERETTVILKKLNSLAEQLGFDDGDDRESRELAKDTPVESIARHLRSKEEEKESETR
jgi:uncharacterized membrane protein